MEQTKEINATLANEELHDIDANEKAPDVKTGKKVDKAEIIKMISQLPVKERMDLIRDLQNTSNTDGDFYSTGREGNISHYDTLRDGYQTKAKEAESKKD